MRYDFSANCRATGGIIYISESDTTTTAVRGTRSPYYNIIIVPCALPITPSGFHNDLQRNARSGTLFHSPAAV